MSTARALKVEKVLIHSFEQNKAESKSPEQQRVDKAVIRLFLPEIVEVTKTDVNIDRTGVDYKATLRKGAVLLIDAKSRKPGCRRFWKHGPELAIEKWSVKPGGKYKTPEDDKKAGWALCESTNVDLIMYTFDPSDTKESFLIPFQHLRMALRMSWNEWHALYPLTVQESENEDGKRWESEALLVPAYVVLEAIKRVSRLHNKRITMKYEVFVVHEGGIVAELQRLSSEGWEFVCFIPKTFKSGEMIGVFKRYAPIPEEVAQAANNDKAFLTKG